MRKIGFILIFLLVKSIVFAQIKLEVELALPLQLPNQPLYVATSYDNWDPGNSENILKKIDETHYAILLKNAPDSFEYKFTQGSWMSVEGTPAGENLPNRVFQNNGNGSIQNKLLGWEKLISYDIIVENIPENTPKDARIYISGNFNGWNAANPHYELKKFSQGGYKISIKSDQPRLEYKFTRGSWDAVEAKTNGKSRSNRIIAREAAIDNKAIKVNIDGWEDLMGTIHIYSLLDLLLMFSVFQSILLVIGIPFIRTANVEINRWLILSLVVSALAILLYFMSNFKIFVNIMPRIVLLSDFIYFLYGPIFYLYLRRLLFLVKGLSSNWYLHFIPFLIQFFVYLPFLLQNDKTFLLNLMNQNPQIIHLLGVTGVLGLLWNIYYWNLFRKTIKTYRAELRINQSYDPNLNLLYLVLTVQLLALCFWLFSLLNIALNKYYYFENAQIFESSIDLTWLVFSVIPYLIGFYAIHQSETFKVNPQQISFLDDPLDSITPAQLPEVAPEKTSENYKAELAKIEKYIADEMPFINAKISLPELAEALDIQPHLLSKIINEHYKQNFFDFINSYRVAEFQSLVQDPKYRNYTFLSLAYEVGFNSKTAFNRAFKKITNQTPKEYFEGLKK
jgi:AraC-like DNA-binding protein